MESVSGIKMGWRQDPGFSDKGQRPWVALVQVGLEHGTRPLRSTIQLPDLFGVRVFDLLQACW